MDREYALLQQALRIARAGHSFFVAMQPGITDVEVRATFGYLSGVKSGFIADLAPYIPTSTTQPTEHTSAASGVEQMYQGLRQTFLGSCPEFSAGLLIIGEEQLLRLVERAFECARDVVVKDGLKKHYSALIVCREAMSRLGARQARAAHYHRGLLALQAARTRSAHAAGQA